VSLVVLKVGGASVERIELPAEACVVVHGAGPQISQEMARRGLEPQFVGGRRVTTPQVLEIVRASFAEVNAQVCAAIGQRAVSLCGDEIGLLAEPRPELGCVGTAIPSAPAAIIEALADGLVPVVTPMALGPLNVNADEAAAALAVGLCAARLVFLSDVPGVFHDGELLETIEAERAEALIGEGSFEGGIVPKLLAAVRAARGGLVAEIGATAVIA
jgi:acetylglutamate kinase